MRVLTMGGALGSWMKAVKMPSCFICAWMIMRYTKTLNLVSIRKKPRKVNDIYGLPKLKSIENYF